jgi:peptidoglycan/xylan/chitin deacetylase (PgdA/CDA1 family)
MDVLHLLYHELRAAPGSYSYIVAIDEFDRHCELFARLQRGETNSLRPELTFDDGHISNYEFALPILQRHALSARFFITAGWIGRRAGYMGWTELRALHAAGQHIGAHGLTHKLLTHCSAAELNEELHGARQRLEDGLGRSITTMSLPGGRANAAVLRACWDAGYTQVFTSVPQSSPGARAPRSTVGRLNIRNSTTAAWLEQALRPETRILAKLERQDRIKRAGKTLLGDHLYAKLWSILNRQEPETDPQAEQGKPEIPAR